MAIRAAFRPEVAGGMSETYEFRIGNRVFEVRIADGQCFTSEGSASRPDAVMTMDAETLNALLFGTLKPEQCLSTGQVEIVGDPSALARFVAIFALAGRPRPDMSSRLSPSGGRPSTR